METLRYWMYFVIFLAFVPAIFMLFAQANDAPVRERLLLLNAQLGLVFTPPRFRWQYSRLKGALNNLKVEVSLPRFDRKDEMYRRMPKLELRIYLPRKVPPFYITRRPFICPSKYEIMLYDALLDEVFCVISARPKAARRWLLTNEQIKQELTERAAYAKRREEVVAWNNCLYFYMPFNNFSKERITHLSRVIHLLFLMAEKQGNK